MGTTDSLVQDKQDLPVSPGRFAEERSAAPRSSTDPRAAGPQGRHIALQRTIGNRAAAHTLLIQRKPVDDDDDALTASRTTPLDRAPAHHPPAKKGGRSYTTYTPSDHRRLKADVAEALAGGSFATRALRVITNDGNSKTFEELSGLDGITFGLSDFATSGGVVSFFRNFRRAYPRDYAALFPGLEDQLVDKRWVAAHNAGRGVGPDADDVGLITDVRVRKGLARLLADPRFRQFQMAQFVRGKIDATQRLLRTKRKQSDDAEFGGLQRSFSLAALASVGNSVGPGVAVPWFKQGLRAADKLAGVARENAAVVHMLRMYVTKASKQRELDRYPDGEAFLDAAVADPGAALARKWRLGHRGGRVRKLFEVFPFHAFDPLPADPYQDDVEPPPAPLELVLPPEDQRPREEPPPAPLVQTKLRVGDQDDPCEHEADRLADLVNASSDAAPLATPQQRPRASEHVEVDTDLQARLARSRGSGAPLPGSFRGRMEAALGRDLGAVRIHTGAEAASLSHALAARAFTVGSDIFLAPGQGDVATHTGRHLLAHEAVHVVQQTGAGPAVQRKRSARATDTDEPRPDLPQQLQTLRELVAANVERSLAARARVSAATSAADAQAAGRELAALLTQRIPLVEAAVAVLELEVEAHGGRPSSEGVGHLQNPPGAAASQRKALEYERDSFVMQLAGLRRWQLRGRLRQVGRELAALPADQTSRRDPLLAEQRRLGAAITGTAHKIGQFEEPWGSQQMGDYGTYTDVSCGPTSLAMLLTYLRQEDPLELAAGTPSEILPPETATYAIAAQAMVHHAGMISDHLMSSLEAATSDPKTFDPATIGPGLGFNKHALEKARKRSQATAGSQRSWPAVRPRRLTSYDEMVAELRQGNQVAFSAASRTGGVTLTWPAAKGTKQKQWKRHFMVVVGVSEDGGLLVLDPGRNTGGERSHIDAKQAREIGQWWVLDRRQASSIDPPDSSASGE